MVNWRNRFEAYTIMELFLEQDVAKKRIKMMKVSLIVLNIFSYLQQFFAVIFETSFDSSDSNDIDIYDMYFFTLKNLCNLSRVTYVGLIIRFIPILILISFIGG